MLLLDLNSKRQCNFGLKSWIYSGGRSIELSISYREPTILAKEEALSRVWKSAVRRLPVEFRIYARRRLLKHRIFDDSYSSWHGARSSSTGYDADAVVATVLRTTKAVIRGEAAFERDSVAFLEHDYSWQVLSGLMLAAASGPPPFRVIDFGGALGSTFFQYRNFLELLPQVEWSVVEQESFVQVAREHIHELGLKFFTSIDQALEEQDPTLMYFGSSLQYLENPWRLLQSATRSSARYLLIDRIPVTELCENRIAVQTVPPKIYPATYPAWLFSRHSLRTYLEENWEILSEFQSLGGTTYATSGTPVNWWGILCTRKSLNGTSVD